MPKAILTQAAIERFTKAMMRVAPDLTIIRMKADGTLEAERGDGSTVSQPDAAGDLAMTDLTIR